jgi:hypothetical protein
MRVLDVAAEDANRLRQTCRRFVQRSGALLLRSLARRGGSAVNGTGAAALRSSGVLALAPREIESRWKIFEGKDVPGADDERRPGRPRVGLCISSPTTHFSCRFRPTFCCKWVSDGAQTSEHPSEVKQLTPSVRPSAVLVLALRSLRWRTAQSHSRRRAHVIHTTSALARSAKSSH